MTAKLLRHRVDGWAALLIFGTLCAQLALYFSGWSVPALIAGSLFLLPARVSVLAYNHNHIHVLTFRHRAANRALEMAMFLQTGISPFSGTLNHIVGHHAAYFDPATDTLNWRRPDETAMGPHEFAIASLIHHYRSCFALAPLHPKIGRGFYRYLIVSLTLLGALAMFDPVAASIVFVAPMLMMLYLLKLSAYAHHSGLPVGDDFAASRTNTGKFYNWITWNAGFHAAHHFKQALHWSKLPAYHAELAPRIAADLQGRKWGENFAVHRGRAPKTGQPNFAPTIRQGDARS